MDQLNAPPALSLGKKALVSSEETAEWTLEPVWTKGVKSLADNEIVAYLTSSVPIGSNR